MFAMNLRYDGGGCSVGTIKVVEPQHWRLINLQLYIQFIAEPAVGFPNLRLLKLQKYMCHFVSGLPDGTNQTGCTFSKTFYTQVNYTSAYPYQAYECTCSMCVAFRAEKWLESSSREIWWMYAYIVQTASCLMFREWCSVYGYVKM